MVIVCMGHGYDISVDFGHLIANVRVVRVGDNRRSRAFFKFERGMAEPSDFHFILLRAPYSPRRATSSLIF